ncbi:tetratricopeptide repeat protein [Prochlorococcus marinus]|uniref:tetratricopeptide repeat protein n=1 Tax=Prochlorococcus marinus TaxID=1219 RepID=UPI00030BBF66|nr:tetratricopeptide repeat protein [Prochlorococcus marinus]
MRLKKVLRRALASNPEDINCLVNLGILLKKEGEFEEAIASYRKAIEVKPDFVEAHSSLGQMLMEKGDYLASTGCFKQALSLDNGHFNSSASLGFSFFLSGDIDSAIFYYSHRLALEFCPISAYYLFRSVDRRIPEKINAEFDIASDFCASAMRYMGIESVLAFGDSHVMAFSGVKGIEVNYVGASTAYNLLEEKSSSGGSERVWSRLRKVYGDKASIAIMLCFGEIDCRNHVVRQCYLRRMSIRESVSNVVSKYLQFIHLLHEAGFKVIVYGCYGSGSHFNAVGSEVERNLAAYELNQQLREACLQINVPCFSLIDLFVDEYGYTRKHLMSDDAHLPEKGNAGIEVRSILMARFLQSCKQMFSLASTYDSHLTSAWENSYCNYVIVNLGTASQAICHWDVNGFLALMQNSISNLWLDLGSHLLVGSLGFQFDEKSDISSDLQCPFYLKLDGQELSVKKLEYTSRVLTVEVDCRLGRYIEILPAGSAHLILGDITRILPGIVKAY